ncbi:MAG: GspH/FimT family pseudopilin [Thermodesulfobacteriota bacterium]|nr:GspH/FimT family pseudopilin [Thermodesulfobacteriota bacterium]
MQKQGGFTFLEMMVILAIVATLSVLVAQNIVVYKNNQQVSRAARKVYSVLKSAKMTAIKDNTTILVQFSQGTGANGTYQVFEDLDADNAFTDGTDRDIESGEMPPSVTLSDDDDPAGNSFFALGSDGSNQITAFTPMGLTTGNNGTVRVTNGQRTADVVVNTAGGIRVD